MGIGLSIGQPYFSQKKREQGFLFSGSWLLDNPNVNSPKVWADCPRHSPVREKNSHTKKAPSSLLIFWKHDFDLFDPHLINVLYDKFIAFKPNFLSFFREPFCYFQQ